MLPFRIGQPRPSLRSPWCFGLRPPLRHTPNGGPDPLTAYIVIVKIHIVHQDIFMVKMEVHESHMYRGRLLSIRIDSSMKA